MIALDTNLLVYAHRSATPQHLGARRAIEAAAGHAPGWGIALASVAEFWMVVTHPSSSGRPSTSDEARRFLQGLARTAGMKTFHPAAGFTTRLLALANGMGVGGPRIFDLQIGLMCIERGASSLWTHDRAFVGPPGLELDDPLA